jgi:hypothetical protein
MSRARTSLMTLALLAEQLHDGEGHRPTLTVARVVRPAKGDPLAVKGDHPVIAGRDV